MLTLAFSDAVPFSGWGTCNRKLTELFPLRVKTERVTQNSPIAYVSTLRDKVLHTIKDTDFTSATPVLGKYNAGYCFFETLPTGIGIHNAAKYDHIFCGSTYNAEILKQYDIYHTSVAIQGVDPVFRPLKLQRAESLKGKFVIYSGGKFEYRKGQDLVLAAFKALQSKYRDLHLITTWANPWKFSMETMEMSKFIIPYFRGQDWQEIMANLMAKNRIYPGRVTHYPLVDHRTLTSIIRNTDLGIFPNRCEGGTNLALMEYMACGKPVIASYNTGHMDVLSEDNAMLLREMKPVTCEPMPGHTGEWYDPSLDELIASIEYAYENREELPGYGERAEKSMKRFSWSATVDHMMSVMFDPIVDSDLYLPHRYKIGNMLNRLKLNGSGAEIGVCRGEFSVVIRRSWNGKQLYLVDRWKHVDGYLDKANHPQEIHDFYHDEVVELFKDDPVVKIMRMDSEEAASQIEDGSLDWVYIDADHSYDGCKRDLNLWHNKVKTGGIVAGHDYMDGETTNGIFGVKSAVDEFVSKHGINLMLSCDESNPLRTWYFVKG